MSSSSTSSGTPMRHRKSKSRGRKLKNLKAHAQAWNQTAMTWPAINRQVVPDGRIFTFSQKANLGTLFTSSVTVPAGGGTAFTLATAFSQYASYTAIFDQYRIDSVETWLYASVVNSTGGSGLFYSAIDYDGVTAATPAALINYTNVLTTPANEGHYHKFKPHVAVAALGAGAFSSYANQDNEWIDSAYSSVSHYGLVAATDIVGGAGSAAEAYQLVVRLVVSFRNIV